MGYPRRKYVRKPTDKTREELEGSYTTVTVEGTGTKAQFTHLSDRLVRGSRIFWRLSEKILEAKRMCGLWKSYFMRKKSELKALTKAFKQYEKEADKLFKAQEIKIEKLTKLAESARGQAARHWRFIGALKADHKKVMANQKKYLLEYERMKKYKDFFTKKLYWKYGKSEAVRVEIFLRTIFEYKQLEAKKELNHHQMMYLAVGHQMEAFNREHIINRFGEECCIRFVSLMNDLIDKGYIRRFERRNLYYVTEDGKNFFSSIFKEMYTNNFPSYWTEVTKNLKYE